MGSAMLKEAVYALKIYYYDSEEIVKTVIGFALAAAASAAASGCLPGAGSTVAIAVSLGFVVECMWLWQKCWAWNLETGF